MKALYSIRASLITQLVKNPLAMRDLGSIPGLGRSPGEGKGCLLQYSGLENSMDCVIHGVAKCRTRLRDLHFKQVRKRVTVIHDPSAHVLNTETF